MAIKRYSAFVLIFLSSLWFYSCATTYPLVVQTTLHTADSLKDYCQRNGIDSPKTKKAYDFLIAGREKLKADEEEEAYRYFDLVVLTYRLAIAEQEYKLSQESLKQAEAALNKAQEELDAFRKVLKELKLPMIESNI